MRSRNDLLIVGCGPSSAHAPDELIDEFIVCRLNGCSTKGKAHRPNPGTRTDIMCSASIRHARKDAEFWHIDKATRARAVKMLAAYSPKWWKPSTGLTATMIAKEKGYNVHIIGFDCLMHPENCKDWKHDVFAEHKCISDLGIIDVSVF